MTLAEQADAMAERLEEPRFTKFSACGARSGLTAPHIQFEAAALLRQCAEALRKEGV